MNPAVAQILSTVGLETLEKMAFIFGASNQDPGPATAGGGLAAVQVRFNGRFCGLLELRLSTGVLPELAANMLGIDERGPVAVDRQHDALGEIANVVCGRLLPLVGGREAEFVIQPPAVIDLLNSEDTDPPYEIVARARLDLEDGVCELALAVDEGLPVRPAPEAVKMSGQSMEWDTL